MFKKIATDTKFNRSRLWDFFSFSRLSFYTFLGLAFKVFIIALITFLPLRAWMAPDLFQQESAKVIAATNCLRAELKLQPLKENRLLSRAADLKVQDMILNQYFSHTSPEKRSLSTWLKMVGYQYIMAGENLAIGFQKSEELINVWSESRLHYANLINPNYSEIGVALADGVFGGEKTTLAVQLFAQPKKEVIVLGEQITESSLTESEVSTETKTETLINDPGREDVTEVLSPEEISLVDDSSSFVTIKKIPWNEALFQVQVVFKEEVSGARVSFKDYELDLYPAGNNNLIWLGQKIIPTRKDFQESLVPPTLIYWGNDKMEEQVGIRIEEISPAKASIFAKYFYIKYQPLFLNKVFAFNSIYYGFVLALLSVLFLLNLYPWQGKKSWKRFFLLFGLMAILVFLIVL